MSGFITTDRCDVFTPEQIKEWHVKPWGCDSTRWHKGQKLTGWVKKHCVWVYNPDQYITAYKYHRTEILRIGTGVMTIDTGGYNTPTTMRHLNKMLPWGKVHIHKGTAYFYDFGASKELSDKLELTNEEEWVQSHVPYGKVSDIYPNYFILEYNKTRAKFNNIKDIPTNPKDFILMGTYGELKGQIN